MHISGLFRYPLKGGAQESIQNTTVMTTGLPFDRQWMLIDADGEFLSQRTMPNLGFCNVKAEAGLLTLSFRSHIKKVAVVKPIIRQAKIWSDQVEVIDQGEEAAIFFSGLLNKDVRLCSAQLNKPRYVPTHSNESAPFLFADAYPFLVVSEESLDMLNEKLRSKAAAPVEMLRFRPNIVVKGWQPHAEDEEQILRIGEFVYLYLASPCTRCSVPQIDPVTGIIGKEPLATMVPYRKKGSKVYFGVNAWLMTGAGQQISVGDPVTVLSKSKTGDICSIL